MFLFKIMHESTGKYPYEKTFFFSADIDSKIAKGEKNLMVAIKICIFKIFYGKK